MTIALTYIAGRYRNADPWIVEQNIRAAEALAYEVDKLGSYAVCPHTNSRAYFSSANDDAFWLGGTLELMRRCDAVMLVPGWEESSGARAEREEALRLGLPVFWQLHTLGAWLTARGAR